MCAYKVYKEKFLPHSVSVVNENRGNVIILQFSEKKNDLFRVEGFADLEMLKFIYKNIDKLREIAMKNMVDD